MFRFVTGSLSGLSLSHVDYARQFHCTISNTCCVMDAFLLSGCAMAWAVHSQPLTAEAQVESHASLCAICGAQSGTRTCVNPLNPELNPICYLLALLAHHFLRVSRIRVKSLTLRLLMSYIYIYIYMERLFLMFLDHT